MRRSFRRAFTLVELLVVIGIIVALIAILLPAVNKAYKNAQRTSMQADLAVISQALDAYRNDFGDYPRIDNPLYTAQPSFPGSVVLCWALVSPGPMGSGTGQPFGSDGYGDPSNQNAQLSGPGFRVRGTTGTVHPAYLNLDKFKIGAVDMAGNVTTPQSYSDANSVILDHFGKPILYFVANKAAVAGAMIGYARQSPAYPGAPGYSASQSPRFNYDDNAGANFNLGVQGFVRMLPGIYFQPPSATPLLDPSQACTLPYLLWSPGFDGKYGPDPGYTDPRAGVDHSDDVTNFR